MENNNELAKEFAVWCWGKEVSSDVSKIKSLFLTFCAEKELKEKNYEILSFICIKKECIHIFNEIRYVESDRTNSYLSTGSSVANGDWAIHSVKNISDGEIFTLSDKAKTVTSKGSHNIREFVVRQKCLGRNSKGDYIYDGVDRIWVNWEENCGGNWLEAIEKVKPVLFTTLNGVDVFKGDTYWYVNTDTFDICSFTADKFIKPYLPFSTEIAAKNYKEQNEKKYSFKDIERFMAIYSDTAPIKHIKKNIMRDIKYYERQVKNGNI